MSKVLSRQDAATAIRQDVASFMYDEYFCPPIHFNIANDPMRKRLLKISLALLLIAAFLVGGTGFWAYRQLVASLPQLDGEITTSSILAQVKIERDQLGIPTIRAANRVDLAFATGFVHGQDRFFQMDLLRRNAAGELAELIGPAVLERDKATRMNRFRDVSKRRLAVESKEILKVLEAYTAGVNSGLGSLKKHPFEYLMLGSEPTPWKEEDSILVLFSMFLDLQGDQFEREHYRGLLHSQVPQALYDFLMARGDSWDAPIHGGEMEVPPVPGPEAFDARSPKIAIDNLTPLSKLTFEEPYSLGSNNWAVSGVHTADGRVLVANDMHLRIQVPNIWYRASFVWPDESDSTKSQQMTGVTLPGTPAMVVGSNGNIAWGFTNSEGDWLDIVVVEREPNDSDGYLTAEGPKKFEKHKEIIRVKGAPDTTLEVVSTIWGPILKKDHLGRLLACRWVAHDVFGVNVDLLGMEKQKTLEGALDHAGQCGVPHQNFVVGDTSGRIAWTIIGRIPKRFGHDGQLPQSWADGHIGWDGYLNPSEYPRVVQPQVGRIWTANARVVSDDFYKILGDSGYDRGARQQQIRDDLLHLSNATESDMLKIQLDDRAVFLERWQKLLLEVLNSEATAGNTQRSKLRELVEGWGGRASVDSVGYRAVWTFRNKVLGSLSDLVSQPCKKLDDQFSLTRFRRIEGPFWRVLTERPQHFLDPRFESWQDCLLACADVVLSDATSKGSNLENFTWGQLNTAKIQHPLSLAVPAFSSWLDMPSEPLNGGWSDMPRIQGPSMGASQRMAVSPGREEDGYMHIPCGQSGHPLSDYYRNSHPAWVQGKLSPFLPGNAEHTLVLKPKQ